MSEAVLKTFKKRSFLPDSGYTKTKCERYIGI